MLGWIDALVILGYLAVVLTIGLRVGRGQRTTEDYFLASHRVPWWAAGISILATETSALTFIGGPVQSLRGDWTYLQLAIGSSLARILVAVVLIGVYYRARVTTVYGYLGQRYGPRSRDLASVLFVIGRLLGSGVRLYGAAIALVVVTPVGFPLAIAILSSVAVTYTLLGGLRSVVWTDVLQGGLLVLGGVVAFGYLAFGDTGLAAAWNELQSATTPAGDPKLRWLDLSLDPGIAYTLFAGLIGSTMLTMSTHGTDQDMIQRSLACRNAADGRRSLLLSAALSLPVAMLFLAIGSLLWVRLGGDAEAAALAGRLATENGLGDPGRGFDFLFPFYIVANLPAGIRGLLVAAIVATAMSSLDSAISALSTTAVENFWRTYIRPDLDEAAYLRVARWLAVGFGALLVTVAIVVWLSEGSGTQRQGFGVLMLGLKVLSWIFPPLLGIFLLGVLTGRGSDHGNLVAVGVGVGTLLAIEAWPALFGGAPPIAWIWNPVIGCWLTFAVGALFSPPAVIARPGS